MLLTHFLHSNVEACDITLGRDNSHLLKYKQPYETHAVQPDETHAVHFLLSTLNVYLIWWEHVLVTFLHPSDYISRYIVNQAKSKLTSLAFE